VPFYLHGFLALHPCEEAWRHGCRRRVGMGSGDLSVGCLVVTGGAGEPCKSMHEHAGVIYMSDRLGQRTQAGHHAITSVSLFGQTELYQG
jgi:hypothetical protein